MSPKRKGALPPPAPTAPSTVVPPKAKPPPSPRVASPGNAWVRTAQLDGPLCEAIDAWQLAHGIRSTSAAMRLLLERALVEDGTVELGERLTLARASALRAAREAMGAALDRLADGE